MPGLLDTALLRAVGASRESTRSKRPPGAHSRHGTVAIWFDVQVSSTEGVSVIFITTYRIKQQSRDETKKLMGVFADKGVPSTVQSHYVAADGSQGVVISEADDLEEAYRNILNYAEWIEYETKPYLTIEQALPHIADYVG